VKRYMAKKVDWESFGWEIVDKVSRALDYWCHEVSGDTLYDCYSAHAELDLYDLAEEFAGWSVSGITEKDLELLQKMPKRYYDKFNRYIGREIERVVRNLEKEMEEELELS